MNLEKTEDGVTEEHGSKGSQIMQKIICPPLQKGMKILKKEAFDKTISVPSISIPEKNLKDLLPRLKPLMLKIKNVQNVIQQEEKQSKKVLLDPEKVKDLTSFLKNVLIQENEDQVIKSWSHEVVNLTFDHWSVHQLMEAVLPSEQEKFSSFSITGHVVHVNLRDHLIPYKHIIGEILLDKVPGCKTVVNKLDQIESKFRTFQMEVIAGEANTVVHVKENKCDFEFDFSTVYWNSRLASEHEKIVNRLSRDFVVFDVFAGVGPFVIPAAKKKCFVYANDLNPECQQWMEHNVRKNKVIDFVKIYNKDGRQFLVEDVSSVLKEKLQCQVKGHRKVEYHVIMNLPAIGVEFLDAFWNLLGDNGNDETKKEQHSATANTFQIPTDFELKVHLYCFVKATDGFKEKAIELVNINLKYELDRDDIMEVAFVRNVAPNKEMLRVSFKVPHGVLYPTASCNSNRQTLKRKYVDES